MIRLAALGAAAVAGAAVGHAGSIRGGVALVAIGDRTAQVATGFVAAQDRVVTVAHAVPGATTTVRGGDGVARRGIVLRRDGALDLVVLAVPGLGEQGGAGGGAGVRVRRDGAATSVRTTVVRRADARVRSADGRLLARRPVLELRAPIRAGDSGAPVLDAGGRVVGVVFARSSERPGVAYAVDAAGLARLLR